MSTINFRIEDACISKQRDSKLVEVRLATDQRTNEVVAVKVSPRHVDLLHSAAASELASSSGSAAAAAAVSGARLEAEALELVRHPNVVNLLATAETADHQLLFLEYLRGGDLCEYLRRRGPLHEDEAFALFRQLCAALEHIHAKGLAYRGMRLEHCLFTAGRRQLKLIDFRQVALLYEDEVSPHASASASAAASVSAFASQQQHALGFVSPTAPPAGRRKRLLTHFGGAMLYEAPEIFLRTPYHGDAADVWSLGVVLYAMVNGCFPFDERTAQEQARVVVERPLSFRTDRLLTSSLRRLLGRMLAKRPHDRPAVAHIMHSTWWREHDTFEHTPPAHQRGRIADHHTAPSTSAAVAAAAAAARRRPGGGFGGPFVGSATSGAVHMRVGAHAPGRYMHSPSRPLDLSEPLPCAALSLPTKVHSHSHIMDGFVGDSAAAGSMPSYAAMDTGAGAAGFSFGSAAHDHQPPALAPSAASSRDNRSRESADSAMFDGFEYSQSPSSSKTGNLLKVSRYA